MRERMDDALLAALLTVRIVGALATSIGDCDEVFNYWEPTHHVVFGGGMQTWEYAPRFALRSYVYVLLHAFPAIVRVRGRQACSGQASWGQFGQGLNRLRPTAVASASRSADCFDGGDFLAASSALSVAFACSSKSWPRLVQMSPRAGACSTPAYQQQAGRIWGHETEGAGGGKEEGGSACAPQPIQG